MTVFKMISMIYFCLGWSQLSLAAEISQNFRLVDATHQTAHLKYVRVMEFPAKGLFGGNSKVQCGDVCQGLDECHNFYVEGGACVFGLSGDVIEFDSYDVINPASDQLLRTKGSVK